MFRPLSFYVATHFGDGNTNIVTDSEEDITIEMLVCCPQHEEAIDSAAFSWKIHREPCF